MKIIIRQKSKYKNYKEKNFEHLLNQGLIILNKEKGMTSRSFTRFLLDLGIKKAGHAGTLDPNTTGVLPVLINRGNKISSILSLSKKEYLATMYVHKEFDKKNLLNVFKNFTGEINQLVPKLSAVKRQVRKRNIYSIKLKSIKKQVVKFHVSCQAGTYIRKLIHDMGQDLGTGAHMIELERTKSGPYTLKNSLTKSEFLKLFNKKDKSAFFSLESAVKEINKVWIDDGALEPWSKGSPIYFNGILKFTSDIKIGSKIAVFNQANELIGIGISKANSSEFLKSKEGIAFRNHINLI